jgi:hypothetical protein
VRNKANSRQWRVGQGRKGRGRRANAQDEPNSSIADCAKQSQFQRRPDGRARGQRIGRLLLDKDGTLAENPKR